nr:four and a half LIM domains protein 2-like isoform X2 [Labrus bergylta]
MSTSERFDCHYCKESLLGKKYIMKEDTQYCTKCYENLFANCCEGCSLAIGCNSKDLSYKDHHWHDQCFKCAKCSRSLVEKAFAAKDDLLLCTECYANDYSSKCTTCKKTVMPGSRKMEYKGNSWHETCFLCHRCQQPIGTKSFIPKDTGYFCVPCFEKQFAYQCCACKKLWLQNQRTHGNRSVSLCLVHLPGHHNRWSDLSRQAVAPRVFPMHQLQKAAVGPALHLQGELPILPRVLQQPVCKEVCGLHQGDHQSGRSQIHLV